MNEMWKTIPGFGGHYEASSLGRIRTRERVVEKIHRNGKVMRQTYPPRILSCKKADKLGHISVTLTSAGVEKTVFVHRMVLLTFVGECPEGMEGCHGNGIASDNALSNLRWDTHQSNSEDRKAHGNYAVGERHVMAILSESDAIEIRKELAATAPYKGQLLDLGRKYGVSLHCIFDIKHRRSWTHIA